MQVSNLLAVSPRPLNEEQSERIAELGDVRVERIVSTGQSSPPGFWYDQPQAEWVALLAGRAELLFEGDELPVRLGPGDHLFIPAHRKHRVEWTSPEEPTIWLAVYFPERASADACPEMGRM